MRHVKTVFRFQVPFLFLFFPPSGTKFETTTFFFFFVSNQEKRRKLSVFIRTTILAPYEVTAYLSPLKALEVYNIRPLLLWTDVALKITLHNETHFQNRSELGRLLHFLNMKNHTLFFK